MINFSFIFIYKKKSKVIIRYTCTSILIVYFSILYRYTTKYNQLCNIITLSEQFYWISIILVDIPNKCKNRNIWADYF